MISSNRGARARCRLMGPESSESPRRYAIDHGNFRRKESADKESRRSWALVKVAMTSFLFWNLHGRRLETVLHRLAVRHEIDVLILAECKIAEGQMLGTLNMNGRGGFRRIPALASRGLDLYSRLDASCFGPVLQEADHYLIRTFTPPDGIEIVLALAHLASPTHKELRARHSRIVGFAKAIGDAEKGKDRTIVVGDLNVNPFDDALLDVRGLNAIADRSTIRRKGSRRFGKRQVEVFPFFYNPMWSHFGGRHPASGDVLLRSIESRSGPFVEHLRSGITSTWSAGSLLQR